MLQIIIVFTINSIYVYSITFIIYLSLCKWVFYLLHLISILNIIISNMFITCKGTCTDKAQIHSQNACIALLMKLSKENIQKVHNELCDYMRCLFIINDSDSLFYMNVYQLKAKKSNILRIAKRNLVNVMSRPCRCDLAEDRYVCTCAVHAFTDTAKHLALIT